MLRFFTGPNDSLMERLQAAFPHAHLVKAFNSVGNALMVNPSLPGGKPTMFYCGNDPSAKAVVARIIEQFGWEGARANRGQVRRSETEPRDAGGKGRADGPSLVPSYRYRHLFHN